MSGYVELKRMGVVFRPIDQWPGDLTETRRRSPFKSTLPSTMKLLAFELDAVGGSTIVVQIAMSEADFRLDGIPYADRRATHPGVVVAFDSKVGPLKFAVDAFTSWEDNLRAIALGMESLRRVDRYGITKRGEQYTGWKALPMSTDPADAIETTEQAWRVLTTHAGVPVESSPLFNGISEKEVVRRALLNTHPDQGGDPDDFRSVQRAREVIA